MKLRTIRIGACAGGRRRRSRRPSAATFASPSRATSNRSIPTRSNETFTLGMLGNVYEGLTKRDKDLKIIPGSPSAGRSVEPTRWRFHLRKGVKFHNGEDFTADDVVFSAERSLQARARDIKSAHPAGRHQGREGRRPHGRLRPAEPEPDSALRMGHLVHHVEEMGRGENSAATQPQPATR